MGNFGDRSVGFGLAQGVGDLLVGEGEPLLQGGGFAGKSNLHWPEKAFTVCATRPFNDRRSGSNRLQEMPPPGG